MSDLVKVEVIRAYQDHRVGDVITVQPNQVQPLSAMNLIKLAPEDAGVSAEPVAEPAPEAQAAQPVAEKKPAGKAKA